MLIYTSISSYKKTEYRQIITLTFLIPLKSYTFHKKLML